MIEGLAPFKVESRVTLGTGFFDKSPMKLFFVNTFMTGDTKFLAGIGKPEGLLAIADVTLLTGHFHVAAGQRKAGVFMKAPIAAQ